MRDEAERRDRAMILPDEQRQPVQERQQPAGREPARRGVHPERHPPVAVREHPAPDELIELVPADLRPRDLQDRDRQPERDRDPTGQDPGTIARTRTHPSVPSTSRAPTG